MKFPITSMMSKVFKVSMAIALFSIASHGALVSKMIEAKIKTVKEQILLIWAILKFCFAA
jgi:hypothetical protein